MILFFYFKHAPVSIKHFEYFKASVCNFLWPYFLFYRHDVACLTNPLRLVSETCRESNLGIIQFDAAEAQSSRRHFSTSNFRQCRCMTTNIISTQRF